MPDRDLGRAAALIRDAPALLVCAGAGMGVDSGLPDFRGPEGFWRAYPPYRRLGLQFTQLASPSHFASDPSLAWGFYGHRLGLYRATEPHEGFATLHRWGASQVFTSNVDGQFQRASFPDVVEVHGAIAQQQCSVPCHDGIWPAGDVPEVDPSEMRAVAPLPTCPRCGEVARPNILMFGDGGWVPSRTGEQLAEFDVWLGAHDDGLVVVELGAGLAVPTVRMQSEVASQRGALVRINPREPQVPRPQDVGIPLGALDALRRLDALVAGSTG